MTAAEQILTALKTRLLFLSAVEKAEWTLGRCRREISPGVPNPYFERYEAEARALRARFEAEATLRAARATVKAAGFRRSDYLDGKWVRKEQTKWVPYSPEQVADLLGVDQ